MNDMTFRLLGFSGAIAYLLYFYATTYHRVIKAGGSVAKARLHGASAPALAVVVVIVGLYIKYRH
jgi:hypothetical protein